MKLHHYVPFSFNKIKYFSHPLARKLSQFFPKKLLMPTYADRKCENPELQCFQAHSILAHWWKIQSRWKKNLPFKNYYFR